MIEAIVKQYQELCDFLGEENVSEILFRRIRQEIQREIDAIPAGARIAIRPCSADTKKLLEPLDFSNKKIVAIIDKQKKERPFADIPLGKQRIPLRLNTTTC